MNGTINPGTGSVPNATLQLAWKAVRALRRAAGLRGSTIVRAPRDDADGRYGFDVGGVHVLVPGVSLSTLRAPWGLPPRLYVDGSSWMWEFAVEALRDAAGGLSPNDTQAEGSAT